MSLRQHVLSSPAELAIAAGHPVVFEAEGVLTRHGRATDGAASWLARGAGRLAVVSNDAAGTAEDFSRQLATLGLAVPADRVLTAGSAAILAAATRWPGEPVLILASARLCALARSLGLEPASGANAVAVVVAADAALTWARLTEAAAALARGARLLAASADPCTAEGAPGPGAILAALAATVPGSVPDVVGLPAPCLLRQAASRAGDGPAVLVAMAGRAAAARAAGLLHLVPPSDTPWRRD